MVPVTSIAEERLAILGTPTPVIIAATQPAIYTVDQSGEGQGEVYTATSDGLVLATGTRPALPGEEIWIYATGLCKVNQIVADGDPAPEEPPAQVVSTVKVPIDGVEAEVRFAGLAPREVGRYLIKAVEPEAAQPNPTATLMVQVEGESQSPLVNLAIGKKEE